MILNKKAVKKEWTAKPSTIFVHKTIINPLMINKKSPNVKIVTGKVKITKMGFTIKFNNAKTIATTIEVEKLSTATPGRNLAIIKTSIAVIKIRTKTFIFDRLGDILVAVKLQYIS